MQMTRSKISPLKKAASDSAPPAPAPAPSAPPAPTEPTDSDDEEDEEYCKDCSNDFTCEECKESIEEAKALGLFVTLIKINLNQNCFKEEEDALIRVGIRVGTRR
jgi:hypothetical protein